MRCDGKSRHLLEHRPRRSRQSSSMSNHMEVTLLGPCSRCSSVMIFSTTTSIMHRANSMTNIAKFEPWWWNWKAPGKGPAGGQAATYVARVDTPDRAIVTPSSASLSSDLLVAHSAFDRLQQRLYRVCPRAALSPTAAGMGAASDAGTGWLVKRESLLDPPVGKPTARVSATVSRSRLCAGVECDDLYWLLQRSM
ncbi:unnamed protein product, partial [Iphiclides podalirius]